ncbi:transporter substrate-binding domain-containing protein [Psychromonas sp. SP041]|uniref:transporter substrate-binding domain-containing protein n=1 Tax=Psychromonas sp. SP041 TaxID=1365007 RepID=UPI0003FFDA33|nr:transporter substrate-binding domain-containing protein [Psychromonas sp. SP041]
MKLTHIALITIASFSLNAQADLLDDIQEKGVLTVGTTGDYKPFTYFDGSNYSGYDVDVAKHVAEQLGVEVRFVNTTWKRLVSDLKDGKYDIAMGGITRRMSRQLAAEQSQGYMTFGKVFLVANGKEAQYDTLQEVNVPSVKVGVNIGGTNEKFAEQFLTKATIVKYENNLDVPKAVSAGTVDVMVTETPEALYYQTIDKTLQAVREENPFTKSQFGYLMPTGEQRLLNTVNFIMDEMKLKGVDETLMKKNSLM